MKSVLIMISFCLVGKMLIGQETKMVELSGGFSYAYAPTLKLGSISTSGNFWSIYGDLTLNKQIVGRLQFSNLLAGSLGDFKDSVESGIAFNGSLGYNISVIEQLSVPVMGTMGYARITKTSNNFRQEQGLQYGMTISPKYYITDNLIGNVTFRYIKGSGAEGGSKLDQTDISIGLMYAIY